VCRNALRYVAACGDLIRCGGSSSQCVAVCCRVLAVFCGVNRVASVSRIDKIIGLFCKRALSKRRYFAKETYKVIDATDCSHPIAVNRDLMRLAGVSLCVAVCCGVLRCVAVRCGVLR